jgi:hypothetical protein
MRLSGIHQLADPFAAAARLAPRRYREAAVTTSSLIRWSGAALAIGGVSIAGFYAALTPFGGPNGSTAADTSAPAFLIGHGMHIFGGIFTLFGLVGLYLRYRQRTGTIAFVGFVLAFVGTSLFAGLGMIAEFVAPTLARRGTLPAAPELLGPLVPLTFLPFLLGYLLLGVALMRSGVARWGPISLMLGTLLLSLPWPWPVNLIGAVLFAAGTVLLGLPLWAERTAISAPAAGG